MYIDLIINNEVRRMYLGYMENVHSFGGTKRDYLYSDKVPKVIYNGTPFKNILRGDLPTEIKTSSGNVFCSLKNSTLETYDLSNCEVSINPFTAPSTLTILPVALGSLENIGERYTYKYYEFYFDNPLGGRTVCSANRNTLYLGSNFSDLINDFMLFATDEIINGKRTIILLPDNKYKMKNSIGAQTYGKDSLGRITSLQWYNLNYTQMTFAFTTNITPLDEYILANNTLFYLGSKKQAGSRYKATVRTGDVTSVAEFNYGNLIYFNDASKYFYRFYLTQDNNIERFHFLNGFVLRTDIYNYISGEDNPIPPTPTPPDIPTPEPEDPTDPDNPDNPDNLEPEPSDPVPIPKPSPSPTFSSRLLTAYKLTPDNLSALADEMWTSTFYDNIVKMFQNPMDCLVSLSEYPINVPSGVTKNIQLGNVEMSTAGQIISNPFVTVDLGTVTITEKYNSYLDYMNTQLIIYLPFIGFEQISIDYMNSQLQLQYNVDILSGNCVAILYAISYNSNLQSVVGQWNGNMAYSIPLSGRDFSNMASSLWNTAMSAGSVIASSRIPAVAASGFAKGSPSGFGAPSLGSVADLGNNIINTIESANATTSGGHLSANAGHLGVLQPYVIISRPVQKINANYYASYGRILDAYTSFSALSGFTKVKSCNLFIAGATVDEVREIERLLKEGVIF